MDRLVGRHLGVDGVEKTDELLMPVTLHVPADDGAVEHVEGGKQRGRAMPLVVVGHGAEPALLQGQAGLGAVERLDLALLVDRQHDGMGRRVDVEADNVFELGDELRVVGELEGPPAVGLETVRLPDAAHRAGADAHLGRHHVGSPVRRLARRVGKRKRHHLLADLRPERRNARGARLVAQETLEAFRGEALLPAPHAGLRLAGLSHDLDGADAIGTQQDDLGAPDVLLRRIAITDEGSQALAIGRRNGEGYSCAHAPHSHTHSPKGIPYGLLC
ncbi:hypothetical protein AOX55_00004371 (plasmid) [Sinorhizobium fredii CCBAU 25509]|nr:hypothetical protein AOX55_00004371 [Sinorhizobium fredii CCBAU 25509]